MRRAALFIRLNDLVVGSQYIIPLLNQRAVNGHLNNLRPVPGGWDNTLWPPRDWRRMICTEPKAIALEWASRAHRLGKAWAGPIT